MAERIEGLRDIVALYDVILCDVWGVVHNGETAFLEACAALKAAREAGLTVVLITNSPRRSDGVVRQFAGIGVPDGTFDAIVSSGDVTRKLIEAQGPKKVYLIGPERDWALVEGLPVTSVAMDAAEVIVCTGLFDDETETPEQYRPQLEALRARDLTMICANPDLVVERGTRMIYCAGSLAEMYKRMGGRTLVAGKPHPPIYAASLAAAEAIRGAFARERVLAIGDGLPTDVRGAVSQGLDLLYISGGIHAADYAPAGGEGTDVDALELFLARHSVAPRWWMHRLA